MSGKLQALVSSAQDSFNGLSTNQQYAVGAVAGVTGVALAAKLISAMGGGKKPSSWEVRECGRRGRGR